MYKLPCTNYHVQTTMYKLPCTNYHVQTTMHKLPCTNYYVQTTKYKLPCTNYHVQYKGIRKSELVTKTQFLWFGMVNGLSDNLIKMTLKIAIHENVMVDIQFLVIWTFWKLRMKYSHIFFKAFIHIFFSSTCYWLASFLLENKKYLAGQLKESKI